LLTLKIRKKIKIKIKIPSNHKNKRQKLTAILKIINGYLSKLFHFSVEKTGKANWSFPFSTAKHRCLCLSAWLVSAIFIFQKST